MIFDGLTLSKAKTMAAIGGPILTKSCPTCCKCHQRKSPAGGKRYFNKFGRRMFVCKECVNG